ncbi:MAG: hypothetical protein KF852_10975 [Saprospiraceae bacterium]|nr:hypothetical protein [Saprospiraceae bacterium]
MKMLRLFPLVALIGALALTGAGCKKDKDPDRLAFLGSFTVIESCSATGNHEYSVSITESSTAETDIIINNFGDFGSTIRATVSGSTLTISAQTINVQNTAINVSNGTGSLNGNLLTIAYTYSVLGNSESCSMVCTKL